MGLKQYQTKSDGNYDWTAQRHLSRDDLVDYTYLNTDTAVYVQAKFKDSDSRACTLITQDYMFFSPRPDHEPHKMSPFPNKWPFTYLDQKVGASKTTFVASRFVPSVTYDHQPGKFKNPEKITETATTKSPFRFKSWQRLHFNASSNAYPRTPQRIELLTDRNLDDTLGQPTAGLTLTRYNPGGIVQEEWKHNPKRFWHIIVDGVMQHKNPLGSFGFNPDNIHQTYQNYVDWPKGGRSRDRFGNYSWSLIPKPGCPECLHMHWRWTDIIGDPNNIFGKGKAMIPNGSKQSVSINISDDSLNYIAAGKGNHDSFLGHGGFYSSKGTWTSP